MRQQVMTLMFDARIDAMAKELAKMEPGELDPAPLKALHAEVSRLLHEPSAYERVYGLPQESHEG
jgi:hypothetical protein